MKIKISKTYQIWTELKASKEVDLHGLTDFLENKDIEDIDDIKWFITDYLEDIDAFSDLYEDGNYPNNLIDDIEYCSIDNIDELAEHFKYLIKDV